MPAGSWFVGKRDSAEGLGHLGQGTGLTINRLLLLVSQLNGANPNETIRQSGGMQHQVANSHLSSCGNRTPVLPHRQIFEFRQELGDRILQLKLFFLEENEGSGRGNRLAHGIDSED